jgi:NitT/TauT family transport system substrate-binding protein
MRAVFALSCAVAVSLCGTPARAEQITVSQYGKLTQTLPWAVALKKGFFKDEGLNIDGITSSSGGGTSLRNMLAGAIPYADIATPTALAGIKQGIDLRIVMGGSNHIGDLVWATQPNSGINSIKDLVGKKAAFTAPKSTTEMVIRNAVDKAGLAGKVEVLPIGGLGPAVTALNQGAIAAAPVVDPILSLEPEKFKILFHAYEVFPQFTWSVGVVTREFAEKSPDTIRKILRVHRRAVDFMDKNRDEAAQIYADVFEFKVADAKKLLPKYFEWQGYWSRGDFSKDGLQAVSQGLMTVGEIDKPIDWSKVIDQSFLDPDLRRTLW